MSTEIKTGNMPASVISNNTTKATKANGQSEALAQPQGQQRVSSDTVSITDQVSRLQSIENELSTIPVVNEAKVAEIKAAIADGSFEIDPQSIASKLIDMESSAGS